jgi:hypothetical protein
MREECVLYEAYNTIFEWSRALSPRLLYRRQIYHVRHSALAQRGSKPASAVGFHTFWNKNYLVILCMMEARPSILF